MTLTSSQKNKLECGLDLNSVFYKMGENGLISFSDYVFLLVVLSSKYSLWQYLTNYYNTRRNFLIQHICSRCLVYCHLSFYFSTTSNVWDCFQNVRLKWWWRCGIWWIRKGQWIVLARAPPCSSVLIFSAKYDVACTYVHVLCAKSLKQVFYFACLSCKMFSTGFLKNYINTIFNCCLLTSSFTCIMACQFSDVIVFIIHAFRFVVFCTHRQVLVWGIVTMLLQVTHWRRWVQQCRRTSSAQN